MALQKMSKEHTIDFLFGQPDTEPKADKIEPEKIVSESIAKKLNSKFEGDNLKTMTSKSIINASAAGITNNGGPSAQMKSRTAPSIWEPDKLDQAASEKDAKTKTQEDKKVIADNRRTEEQKRMNEMVETLQNIDQRKASEVAPMQSYAGHGFRSAKNNISLFDKGEFERVAETTEGERASQESRQRREQKDNWKSDGRISTTKGAINKLFDKLVNQEKEK